MAARARSVPTESERALAHTLIGEPVPTSPEYALTSAGLEVIRAENRAFSRSGDQGSAVQQLATTNVENVCVNHQRHEMLENRVVYATLSPQIAKSFSAHVACDRD